MAQNFMCKKQRLFGEYIGLIFVNSGVFVSQTHVCMKKFILLTQLFFLYFFAFSQDLEIKGTVTDSATGEALIGVNIYVEGTRVRGTVTDFDGTYVLNVSSGDIVVF